MSSMKKSIKFPPKSILIDSQWIVNEAEYIEMEQMIIDGNISDEEEKENNNNKISKKLKQDFAYVVGMAALLHLGKYTYARNVWRRYRPTNSATSTNETNSMDVELTQLTMLWSAGQCMGCNNYKGAYCALEEASATGLYPLSIYAKELIESYRNRMADIIESSFITISSTSCSAMLGYNNQGMKSMMDYLKTRGWTIDDHENDVDNENHFLTVPSKSMIMATKMEEEEETMNSNDDMSNEMTTTDDFENRIRDLTEMVGFMETTRLNA